MARERKPKLQLSDTPGCCGVLVLHNLDGSNFYSMSALIEHWRKNNWFRPPEAHTPSLIIATTIPRQRVAIDALKRMNFKEMHTFVNKCTNNPITMWQRVA